MRPGETLLDYLHRCGSAALVRPRGNTTLLARIARYKSAPSAGEAQAIAIEAATHPDPQVQTIAAQLLQEAMA